MPEVSRREEVRQVCMDKGVERNIGAMGVITAPLSVLVDLLLLKPFWKSVWTRVVGVANTIFLPLLETIRCPATA